MLARKGFLKRVVVGLKVYKWLRGVDLYQRPLGYECCTIHYFTELRGVVRVLVGRINA
jgi:hypothetical protein